VQIVDNARALINGGNIHRDYEGQKGKSINDMSIIDEIWVIQRSTKSRYFINDWYKI
jgi:hypothetical protein